jgi:hypothetical protein
MIDFGKKTVDAAASEVFKKSLFFIGDVFKVF